MGLKYLVPVIALLLSLPGALGLGIGGGAAVSTSDADSSAQGAFLADNSQISSTASSQGPVSLDEVHSVMDAAGKEALVSFRVDKGTISSYRLELKPKEGKVDAALSLYAKELLTVKNADRIIAGARSSNGAGDSAEVGVEVQKGSLIGYLGEATATDKSAGASQSINSALGGMVGLKGAASRGSQKSSFNMGILGASGQDAQFKGSSASSSSVSIKSSMDGRIKGAVSGRASAGDVARARDSKGGIVDCNMVMRSLVDGSSRKVDGSGTFYAGGTAGGRIQSAVDAAWDGDSISLGRGIYDENVVIDKSLSILGQGPGKTVVDGGARAAVFTIKPSARVVLYGMTIKNGSAGTYENGGGILNEGQAFVNNCMVTGNLATYGGGIYNDGQISISNSKVADNFAESSGGGLLNNGVMTVSNTDIANNVGLFSAGGFANWGTMTARNIHVSGNEAFLFNGGGAANGGTLDVTGSEFTNNRAESGSGGGLVNWGRASISGGRITGNTASGGGGICNIATQGGVLILSPTTRVSGNKPDDIARQ